MGLAALAVAEEEGFPFLPIPGILILAGDLTQELTVGINVCKPNRANGGSRVHSRKTTMTGVGQRFGGAVAAGAFPLLFGGGIGQATGGFLGGLGSGKMFSGLTVGLQVLGGMLDKLAADTQAVALASREAGTALQLMTERNLFSTKEIQRIVRILAKLGKAEELASLLTSELVEKLGSEGFDALQDSW